MSFLAPLLLGFLILIPILILIYFIRAERRREIVSSTILWRNLIQDLEVRSRFKRPPITLLLILQLIALLLGGLALGRPLFSDPTPRDRQVIVVVDGSASMNAADVSPSRFAEAKRLAREAVANVGGGTVGSVILAGARAELVASGRDRDELIAAIDRLAPGDSIGDLTTGWGLAGSIASSRPNATSEVVVLTDGSFRAGFAPIPATPRFVILGSTGDNQAITQVGVRRPLSGSATAAAFVRVTNYSNAPVNRTIRAIGDTLLFKEQVLNLPAQGSVDLMFEPPAGTRVFSAQLVGRDALAGDDNVDSVVAQVAEREVLLVSPSPDLMGRALRAIPDFNVRVQSPGEYSGPGRAALVVFDKFLPPALPNVPLLIVSPPVGSSLADARYGRPAYVASAEPASALLAGVDLAPLEFGAVARLLVPQWASVAVRGQDGPLILEGEREGRRAVVMGFDPLASNLPKLVAFPALIANAVDWLLQGPDGAVRPGDAVRLPGGLDGQIVAPDGSTQPAASAVYGATDRVGRYALRRPGADPVTIFAVNLADEIESSVLPQQVQAPPPIRPVSLPAESPADGIEFWPWLVAGVLLLTTVEWYLFCRRGMA